MDAYDPTATPVTRAVRPLISSLDGLRTMLSDALAAESAASLRAAGNALRQIGTLTILHIASPDNSSCCPTAGNNGEDLLEKGSSAEANSALAEGPSAAVTSEPEATAESGMDTAAVDSKQQNSAAETHTEICSSLRSEEPSAVADMYAAAAIMPPEGTPAVSTANQADYRGPCSLQASSLVPVEGMVMSSTPGLSAAPMPEAEVPELHTDEVLDWGDKDLGDGLPDADDINCDAQQSSPGNPMSRKYSAMLTMRRMKITTCPSAAGVAVAPQSLTPVEPDRMATTQAPYECTANDDAAVRRRITEAELHELPEPAAAAPPAVNVGPDVSTMRSSPASAEEEGVGASDNTSERLPSGPFAKTLNSRLGLRYKPLISGVPHNCSD